MLYLHPKVHSLWPLASLRHPPGDQKLLDRDQRATVQRLRGLHHADRDRPPQAPRLRRASCALHYLLWTLGWISAHGRAFCALHPSPWTLGWISTVDGRVLETNRRRPGFLRPAQLAYDPGAPFAFEQRRLPWTEAWFVLCFTCATLTWQVKTSCHPRTIHADEAKLRYWGKGFIYWWTVHVVGRKS